MKYSEQTLSYVVQQLQSQVAMQEKLIEATKDRITNLNDLIQVPGAITLEVLEALHGPGINDLSYATSALRGDLERARMIERATFTLRRKPRSKYGNYCSPCRRSDRPVYTLIATDGRPSWKYNTNDGPFCSIECARKSNLIGAATAPIKVPNPYKQDVQSMMA